MPSLALRGARRRLRGRKILGHKGGRGDRRAVKFTNLRASGIMVSEPQQHPEYHPGSYAIFFKGPDGIRLEIVARTSTRQVLKAWWEEQEGFLREALGMNGIVAETEHRTDFIVRFWLTPCYIRHIRARSRRFEIVDNELGAKLLENTADITLSGQNDKLING